MLRLVLLLLGVPALGFAEARPEVEPEVLADVLFELYHIPDLPYALDLWALAARLLKWEALTSEHAHFTVGL